MESRGGTLLPRALPWILAAAALGIVLLEVLVTSIVLLPFVCIPVVIAAGFASSRSTAGLAVLTVLLAAFAGQLVYSTASANFWLYLAAISAISALAVWLSVRRGALDSARRRAQRQVETTEEDFRLALESSVNGVALVDVHGRIYSANPALCALTGRDAAWLTHHEVADLLVDQDAAMRQELRRQLLAEPGSTLVREHRMLLAYGREGWVKVSTAVMRDGDGRPRGFVSQFEDITEERSTRRTLERRASRDPLTGLLNRDALMGELGPMVGRVRRRDDGLAVLYLDLDGLKPVNDTLGHAAGDQLISTVANRIAETVRNGDVVARMGGDEFVVVLIDVNDVAAAEAIAQKVRRAVGEPMSIDGADVTPAVSIGCALDEANLTVADLLDRADRALYRAKGRGGNCVVPFDPAQDRPGEALPARPRV